MPFPQLRVGWVTQNIGRKWKLNTMSKIILIPFTWFWKLIPWPSPFWNDIISLLCSELCKNYLDTTVPFIHEEYAPGPLADTLNHRQITQANCDWITNTLVLLYTYWTMTKFNLEIQSITLTITTMKQNNSNFYGLTCKRKLAWVSPPQFHGNKICLLQNWANPMALNL